MLSEAILEGNRGVTSHTWIKTSASGLFFFFFEET